MHKILQHKIIIYSPYTRGDCVILVFPWNCVIYSFSIHLQPGTHPSQSPLKQRNYCALFSWTNINEYVSTIIYKVIIYSPYTRGDCVILVFPWNCVIYSFSIHLQPGTHPSQSLLKQRNYCPLFSWTHIDEYVSTTTAKKM